MAERYHGEYSTVYNHGSTVFQPERKTEKERRAQEKQYVQDAKREIEKRTVEKNAQRHVNSVGRILFMGIVLAACVFLLSTYIMSLSERNSLKREITALEKQQETLRRENILLANDFENRIDYQEAYDYATQALGMTVPEKRQIIYYSRSIREYVVKTAEIPHE